MERKNGKIKLWTRQDKSILNDLEEKGVYRVKKEYIDKKMDTISDFYFKIYDWYTKKASEIVPKPKGVEYPIWLSTTSDVMLQPTKGTVILEVEVDEDLVIITDFEKWGYVANWMYLPLNEDDEKKHDKELRKYGIGDETALIMGDKGNFYPLLKDKIIKSWDRLFDNSYKLSDSTQGTIWELKKEWITNIVYSDKKLGDEKDE